MNWLLLTAGILMLFGAGLHFVVGDEALRKFGELEFPPNPFGGPKDTKVALRVTWHFGTVAFVFLGAWLTAAGLNPDGSFAVGVAYLSGTMLSCLALIGVTIRIYRRGLKSLFKHPGLLLLTTAAILVWLGSISL